MEKCGCPKQMHSKNTGVPNLMHFEKLSAAKNMLKKELHLVTVPDTFMAGKDGHLVRMNLTKRWK